MKNYFFWVNPWLIEDGTSSHVANSRYLRSGYKSPSLLSRLGWRDKRTAHTHEEGEHVFSPVIFARGAEVPEKICERNLDRCFLTESVTSSYRYAF